MKAKGRRHKPEGGRGEGDASSPASPSPRKASRGGTEAKAPGGRLKAKASAGGAGPGVGAAGTVAVVGAGRLGSALALALGACGYEVRALVSREAAHARRAASRANVKALALGLAELERLPAVELLFVTTPDQAVAETAARLAALPTLGARVALHASGALPSEVLAPLRARGLAVGSMHPLAALSDTAAGAESLRRAFYCVEGDRRAVSAARRLVRELGGRSFTIRAEDKALYHAAALMAAGHVVALFDVAADTLARCGLGERRAREVLLPLVRSAVENLSRQTPERALTGSFARFDVETVRKHLRALRRLRGSDAASVYGLLGEHSLGLALRAAGEDPGGARGIWNRIQKPREAADPPRRPAAPPPGRRRR